MYIQIDLAENHTQKLEDFIKKQLPLLTEEILLKNDGAEAKKIIKSCVNGGISMVVNEILQEKKYKNYLRDKIEDVLGYKEK